MKNKNIETSQGAKNELIEAALKLFAINGYEGVSTRQIVEKANVNISAITYYFGGKEGLYKAIIESKVDLFESLLNSVLDEGSDKENKNIEEKKQFLFEFIEKYLNLIFSKGVSQYVLLLFLKEMNNPTSAFDLLYTKVTGKMHKILTNAVAAIFSRPEDDEEMVLLATTLIGQMLIFRFAQTVVLKRLDKDEYDENTILKIKKTILSNVKLIIDNWN